MKAEALDRVFHALANTHRRDVLDIVKAAPGCSVKDVCRHFDMSRIAVMKHLNVLEQSGLLISEKQGRTRSLYLNPVPIQMIHERWSDEYSALWSHRITRLKNRAERRT